MKRERKEMEPNKRETFRKVPAQLGPTGSSGASAASQGWSHPEASVLPAVGSCPLMGVGGTLRHSTEEAPESVRCHRTHKGARQHRGLARGIYSARRSLHYRLKDTRCMG